MNMQAMLKQAQNMQKEMMKIKSEIDSSEFVIGENQLDSDDMEMLSELFMVATNNAMKQVDEVTEKKMSKFGNIPGLF